MVYQGVCSQFDLGLTCGCLMAMVRALAIFPGCCLPPALLLPPEAREIPQTIFMGEKKGRWVNAAARECWIAVVNVQHCLGRRQKLWAHRSPTLKRRQQSLGLGWISIEDGRHITGKCGTLLGPCKTLPLLLILETPYYTFIK